MNTPVKRRGIKFIVRLSILILVCILLSEGVFRLMGYQAYTTPEDFLERKEGGSFFIPDQEAGYKPISGKSTLSLHKKLAFSITTDSEGFRITSHADTLPESAREIWIFGGSFAQGYGVNDVDAFPFLLQQMYPEYRVRNFAVAGYGTLHSLLRIKKNLNSGLKPSIVILAYGGFHNQRNVCSRYWLRAIGGKKSVKGMKYPWARFNGEGNLEYGYSEIEYHPYPLSGISAMMNFFEKLRCESEEENLRSKDVTLELIRKMYTLSVNENSHFLVAGIYDHPDTEEMLGLLNKTGIATLDISVDLGDIANRILEEDMHPNAKSHQAFAEKLSVYIDSQK